jgi:hypothetical protein
VSAVVAQPQRNGVNVAELFATPDAVRAYPEAATFRFSVDNRWISGTHNRNQISTFYGVGAEQLRGRVEQAVARSAVYDVLTHGVPISVDVAAG